jgi:hypothetical protein
VLSNSDSDKSRNFPKIFIAENKGNKLQIIREDFSMTYIHFNETLFLDKEGNPSVITC